MYSFTVHHADELLDELLELLLEALFERVFEAILEALVEGLLVELPVRAASCSVRYWLVSWYCWRTVSSRAYLVCKFCCSCVNLTSIDWISVFMLFMLSCKEVSFDLRMPLAESVYVARLAGSLSAIPEEIVTVPKPPVLVESTVMVSPSSARPDFDVS